MQKTSVAANSAITVPTYLDTSTSEGASGGYAILMCVQFLNQIIITQFDFIFFIQSYYVYYFNLDQLIQVSWKLFVILIIHNKLPMTSNQDYEKLVNEVQHIKRSLNSQKLAHQATIDQLEISYNLNKQLEDVIKSQANTINSQHKQLGEKSNKLAEMSEVYENQLLQLKQFVHAKDRQLQSIRGSLMVTDYDMIRLRVVSQLELVHKNQIDQLNKQIERVNKIWSDEKQAKDISVEKYNHIKKQMDKQAEKYQLQNQDKQKKHVREINKYNQRIEQERMTRRQIERLLESSQKKYQLLHEKYQSQIARMSKQGRSLHYPSSQRNSYQKQSKIQALKANLEQREFEIESIRKKMQKQSSKYSQIIKDLEQKLKDSKQTTIQLDQYNQKIREKEKEIQEITNSYEKKYRILKEDYEEERRKTNKENERKIQQMKQKYRVDKQNSFNQINKIKIETTKTSNQDQKHLKQKIRALEKEKQQLKRELQEQRSERNQKVPTPKFAKPRSQSIEAYKNKLDQANKQIVNLLLEKVSLKQKINKVAS